MRVVILNPHMGVEFFLKFVLLHEKKHHPLTLKFQKLIRPRRIRKLNSFSPGGPKFQDIGPPFPKLPENNTFLTKGGMWGKGMNARGKEIKVLTFSRTFTT